MNPKYFGLSLVLFSIQSCLLSAKESIPDIVKNNIAVKSFPIDTEASAIILSEEISYSVYIESGRYMKTESVHKIIKILKEDALDLASVHIFYPYDDYRHYVNHLAGTTYNVSGNEIVETSIDKEDIFKKDIGKNVYELNFSLPAVKEGSIIDYSYDYTVPYNDITFTWFIQGKYPKLFSKFSVEYPQAFEFTSIAHVYERMKEVSSEKQLFNSADSFGHYKGSTFNQFNSIWIRRNVPGTGSEQLVHNINNLKERLEFQETGYSSSSGSKHFSNSWEKLNKEWWVDAGLGKIVTQSEFVRWLADSLRAKDTSYLGRTRSIYNYVRSNIKCTDKKSNFRRSDIRNAVNKREGSFTDVNLLLAALLVQADVDAAPVILSTTSMVSPSSIFPVLDRLNYMAVAVRIDGNYILLDATDKNNVFGRLPVPCYNGFSWILGNTGTGINLTPALLSDKSVIAVNLTDFTDSTAKVEITRKYGMIVSQILREQWAETDDAGKKFISEQEHTFPSDVNAVKVTVSNADNPDTNIIVNYQAVLGLSRNVNGYFFNPTLIKLFDTNPFKATVRRMPIEFSYLTDVTYYLKIVLPPSMKPDSVAKPIDFDFDNGSMSYKKTINYFENMNTMTVSTKFSINKATFDQGYYESMRDFFEAMMEDNKQEITFQKKK